MHSSLRWLSELLLDNDAFLSQWCWLQGYTCVYHPVNIFLMAHAYFNLLAKILPNFIHTTHSNPERGCCYLCNICKRILNKSLLMWYPRQMNLPPLTAEYHQPNTEPEIGQWLSNQWMAGSLSELPTLFAYIQLQTKVYNLAVSVLKLHPVLFSMRGMYFVYSEFCVYVPDGRPSL